MFVVFSLSASVYGWHETEWSIKSYDFVVCLSVEVKWMECALMHDDNDLCVIVDHGHILIIHGLIPSYHTPLLPHLQNMYRSFSSQRT